MIELYVPLIYYLKHVFMLDYLRIVTGYISLKLLINVCAWLGAVHWAI